MCSNPAANIKDIYSPGNQSTLRAPLLANFGFRDFPGLHFEGRGTHRT